MAVVRTGGKQYLVHEGDVLKIEKINSEVAKDFVLNDVLLTAEDDGSEVTIGQPNVKLEIKATVLKQGRAKKIRVVHYKAKVRYHKVYGHRQPFTEVKVGKIS
ncbi:50S ribosomal protein L21 [Patescibacteria group bacterium]|nr:50S ribosomal protein L21 [Patescibacteria group bacterium]